MTFPVYVDLGRFHIPMHQIMELAGYFAGSQLFILLGRKFPSSRFGTERGLILIVACLFGALIGSRVLAFIESIQVYWPHTGTYAILTGGKTIVGGLAGGWAGVEIAKRYLHITQKTGDRFVFPILLGLSIGRIGCFLEGLPDHTYGVATRLPWGVDFGDGIHRHPTQLYEILFCILLAVALLWRMRKPYQPGELFRFMILGYFSWRFFVEFIKPRETYAGLSPIQMVSLVTACIAAISLRNMRVEKMSPAYG
jgi:phosphatidylglycerol:prolipoprotein diacylglycerol transferase